MGGDSRREVRRIACLRLSVIGKVSSPPWEMVTARPSILHQVWGWSSRYQNGTKKKKIQEISEECGCFFLHTIFKKKKKIPDGLKTCERQNLSLQRVLYDFRLS